MISEVRFMDINDLECLTRDTRSPYANFHELELIFHIAKLSGGYRDKYCEYDTH